MNTYEVDSLSLPAIEKALTKLGPRAKRCGVKQPVLTVGASRFEKYLREGDNKDQPTGIREWLTVTLDAEQPTLNGWQFVAKIEHTTDGNVISKAPGKEDNDIPTALREQEPICDHCRTRRQRNETYYVQHEDGRTATVGSTCIKDFCNLNIDPNALLAYLDGLAAAMSLTDGGIGDDEDERGGSGKHLIEAEYYLTNVAAMIRTYGWLSRGTARQNGMPGSDTATQAAENMFQLRKRSKKAVSLTDADIKLAQATYAWVSDVLSQQPVATRNDYIHNLIVATKPGISYKHIGIVASGITAYLRDQERQVKQRLEAQRKAELPPSKHWLTVGKRGTITATVETARQYDNAFGMTTMIVLRAPTGEVLKWNASGNKAVKAGDTVTLTGTVKAHTEYNGVPQTVLTRCTMA